MLNILLKIISKLFSFVGGIIFTLGVVLVFFVGYIASSINDEPPTDVSKRLLSPDKTKIAFVLRRYDVSVNYIVTIVPYSDDRNNWWWEYSGYRDAQRILVKEFYFSGHPIAASVDENLRWSADSSLLKLTIDAPEYNPYIWAYDFKSDSEVTDVNEIESLWLKRNQIPDSNEVALNMEINENNKINLCAVVSL